MPADPLSIATGELRNRILIQAQSNLPDPETGAPQAAWTTVRNCWAKISTASSKEVYLAMQFTSEVSHVVMVRWSSTPVAAGMRVVFGTRVFTIQATENVLERNVKVNLLCLEVDGITS
jgi:SPP1 family predicted phage head-tail adaptor